MGHEDRDWHVDAEAVLDLLPVGRSATAVRVREHLFKDLCVRADSKADGATSTKGTDGRFRGTLADRDVEHHLCTALRRGDAILGSTSVDSEVCTLIARAVERTKSAITSVSALRGLYIDMNQFHAVVLYFAHFVDLRSHFLMQEPGERDANPDLQRVRAAFASLVKAEGHSHQLQDVFFQLADRCLTRAVIEDWGYCPGAEDFRAACRARAFMLLQALNNTPSLPNSVPGPFGAADAGYDSSGDGGEGSPGRRQRRIEQFATTYQTTYRQPCPKTAEEGYRPWTPLYCTSRSPFRMIGGLHPSPWVCDSPCGPVEPSDRARPRSGMR